MSILEFAKFFPLIRHCAGGGVCVRMRVQTLAPRPFNYDWLRVSLNAPSGSRSVLILGMMHHAELGTCGYFKRFK